MDNKIVVDKSKLKHYKLKITTLSPIHIGTGDVYEPTNYVIDNNKLFAFDEVLFYQSLSSADKNKFPSDWIQIIDFYKSKKDAAKNIAHFECDTSAKVQEAYNKKMNKDGSKNKNQLEIQTTFKNPNTYRSIIPGSSMKGMIDTIMGIYPRKIKENAIRQNLILSDAILLNGSTQIGYMRRTDRDRNQIINKFGGISAIVEVIKENSEFILSLDTKYSFDEIKKNMREYHSQRDNSRYKETQDSFIARVGKFSGMDYVVDDINNATQPRTNKPLGTHSLYDFDNTALKQFGWIKLEIITQNEYSEAIQDIEQQVNDYYEVIKEKQKATKDKIQKSKNEAKADKLKKEQDRIAEEKAEAEAKAKREAELAAMDPLDKLIDGYSNDVSKVINAMKDESIENLEEIKVELAKKLKVIMQKDPKTWEKAKQKALKRKEYIESLL